MIHSPYLHKQILDLPGIIEGAKDGKGRGRQVIAGKKKKKRKKESIGHVELTSL